MMAISDVLTTLLLCGKLCFVKSFEMSFLTNIEIPPPFRSLSSLKVFQNSSIKNLDTERVLSGFVSVRNININQSYLLINLIYQSIRISVLFVMRRFKWSILPGREFLFE